MALNAKKDQSDVQQTYGINDKKMGLKPVIGMFDKVILQIMPLS